MINLNLEDSFTKELVADANSENTRRQVEGAAYSYVTPRVPSSPRLVHVSTDMRNALGMSKEDTKSEIFLKTFSGAMILSKSKPYAMCYGGHQFGHWAGQLGDGRAINLGKVEHDKKIWTLQLKGAGETPYSRTADGLAVLRSSIREHLCSEAMFHLGVPTTRSLSLCLTGDEVLRDVMYDGNAAMEKGAVVCRVAPSFIRFGNFQIFASRGDIGNLKLLADYTIRHFYPEIESNGSEKYFKFFKAVSSRTMKMIVGWQRVGFVHGVMNTDNMSILGQTIDYGPYGWLEGYDKGWTPNTTDRQNKRYRYGNQPAVAHWNLYQLANALFPLVEDARPLEKALQDFQSKYISAKLEMISSKLGISSEEKNNSSLITDMEQVLELTEVDMTIFFRLLSEIKRDATSDVVLEFLKPAFYKSTELEGQVMTQWKEWLDKYLLRLQAESSDDSSRQVAMKKVNPKYVLRNYMAQLAIDAADQGDYSVIEELYQLLKQPYSEQPSQQKWFAKRPEWARHKIGCSMLSCSS